MSVTVTQVRRAVEETSTAIQDNPKLGSLTLQTALAEVLGSPTALTLIANSINQKTGSTLESPPRLNPRTGKFDFAAEARRINGR